MGIPRRKSGGRRDPGSRSGPRTERGTWREDAKKRPDREDGPQVRRNSGRLEILFYAVEIGESNIIPRAFERISWVLPKELGAYDFLAANAQLVAQLATGRIKPREILESADNGIVG